MTVLKTVFIEQINLVYNHFINQNKKVIIFLHKKHSKLLDNHPKITKKWRKTNSLFYTPYNTNDDIYWLYYYLQSKNNNKNTLLITNDNLSDHIFKFFERSKIDRLKESTILNYDIDYDDYKQFKDFMEFSLKRGKGKRPNIYRGRGKRKGKGKDKLLRTRLPA